MIEDSVHSNCSTKFEVVRLAGEMYVCDVGKELLIMC